MPTHRSYTEKRELSRISVDLPVWVLDAHHNAKSGRLVDLSAKGAGMLYAEKLPIGTELTLKLNISSEGALPEIKVHARVRHVYETLSTPDTPPDYRYLVGLQFVGLKPYEQAMLTEFVAKGI